jgi:CheY-like chemotaxis protein
LPERYEGVPEPALKENKPTGWSSRPPVINEEAAQFFGSNVLPPADAIVARPVEDDRDHLREGDRVVLIIEDDLKFARIMVGQAREKGFKAVVATRGDTGLAMANELQPDAITLDIKLPVVDGWSVLDRLKRNPRTRHIPVHVISVTDPRELPVDGQEGATVRAFAYLEKPVSKDALEGAFTHIAQYLDKKVKGMLLVEDDPAQQSSINELLKGEDLEITAVANAADALARLESNEFDCMVVDLVLPGQDGVKLIEQVRAKEKWQNLPIIVYTGKELTKDEERHLKKLTESVIVKSGVKSPDRLLHDTAMFLHRLEGDGAPAKLSEVFDVARIPDAELEGKKVLVVDDDVRNIFAITSVLESHRMDVIYAENGRAGIEALRASPDVDVVLMDVMMPEMDGYETMRAIRSDPSLKSVPIIAITAKALKDDRDKCINAGASDYLPKPVDAEKLIELIGLWAKREEGRS